MLALTSIAQGSQGLWGVCKPTSVVVCNQSSYYAEALKANTTLQSVFLGTKPKRTVVCNQFSYYARTLKANTALQSVFPGTKPERTVVGRQARAGGLSAAAELWEGGLFCF